MTRFVPVTVLMVLLVQSGVAGAQTTTGTLPGGGTLVFEHREIFDDEGKLFEPTSGTPELFHYFNLAHCNCGRANAKEGTFNYRIRETMQSMLHVKVDFWTGVDCQDAAHRPGGNAVTCLPLSTPSFGDLDANLFPGGDVASFNLYEVVNGTKTDTACAQLDSASNVIFALVDTKGASNYDYAADQPVGTLDSDTTTASPADTKPPPLPQALTANPGDGEINLSWKTPTSNATDVVAYQALCELLDPMAEQPPQTDGPMYVTTAETCDATLPAEDVANEKPTPTPLGIEGEMAITSLGDALTRLDETRICGTVTSGTATSMTIGGLENGTPYKVVLVSIDLHGNFAATYFDHTITPVPVIDFWEDLHNRGSKAEGGLCLLAETYGDDSSLTRLLRAFRDDTLGGSRAGRWLGEAYYATLGRLGAHVHGSIVLRGIAAVLLAPAVGIALLWHWLSLPGLLALIIAALWCRRRWHRTRWMWLRSPAIAAMAVVMLGAGHAHAGGYQPYWENSEIGDTSNDVPVDDPSLIEWHAGLRLGPYVPDIDGQIATEAGKPGPYEQMFGGYHMMTMLDVDRVVWTGFGQVALGGSIGYWQKTARPFTMTGDMDAVNRPRQPGEKNAFRLVPLELSATYRLTTLDDDYGIPLIPYLRGGLAYYVWWITVPNGNFARVCDGSGEMCGDKALGASLGLQGALGLSIRAERIDASAARSMKNSGIQHAGVYAELSVAKVDGFGSDKKLSVGDTTWFAGVDFEF